MNGVPSATPPVFDEQGNLKVYPDADYKFYDPAARPEAIDGTAVFAGNTAGAPEFDRPVDNGTAAPVATAGAALYEYQARTIRVDATGSYTITNDYAGYDGYLCLYTPTFSAAAPLTNALQCDDDNITTAQSQIVRTLTAGVDYVVVTTGFNTGSFGPYLTTITGPGNVEQINACVAPPASIVGWYMAEQNANDSATPPASNAVSYTGAYATGVSGSSFDLDSGEFANLGANAEYNFPTEMSVDAWVDPDANATVFQTVVAKWGAGAGEQIFGLWLRTADGGVTRSLDGYVRQSNGVLLNANGGSITAAATTFAHVAMTYDQTTGTLRVFLNGAVAATAVGTPGLGLATSPATPVTMGGDVGGAGDSYEGRIDELELFNSELTTGEVAAIAGAGGDGKCYSVFELAQTTANPVVEGNAPVVEVTYTITRNGETNSPATVSIASSNGTAIGDAGSGCSDSTDFEDIAPLQTVPFAAGQTEAQFTVEICTDAIPEASEQFSVSMTGATGGFLGTSTSVTTTINDDDFATVQVRPAGGSLGATASVAEGTLPTPGEGTNLEFVFTRTGPLAAPLTIGFNASGTACGAGGTCAAPGNDYAVTAGPGASAVSFVGPDGTNTTTTSTVTFAAGSATAVVIVNPVADADVELDETVIFTPRSQNGGVSGTGATGTITNDDTDATIVAPAAPVVEGITPGNAAEGANLQFTVRRSGSNPAGQVINFNLGGAAAGSAAGGTVACRLAPCADGFPVDFVVVTGTTGNYTVAYSAATNIGTVTFTAANPTPAGTFEDAIIQINPTGDENIENNEDVVVNLTTGSYDVITGSATGTINNDDWNVTVTPTDATADEGTAGDVLTYTFTRNGVNAPQLVVLFTIATGNPTYAVWPADFEGGVVCGNGPGTCSIDAGGLTGTITIPNGGTTASNTLTVDPLNDAITEPNEQFIITVANSQPTATYYLANPNVSAIGTIVNDDATVTVAVSNSPISESAAAGQTMLYTFTRTGDLTDPLTVAFTVSGTATFNTDYTATIDPSSCVPTCTFATGAGAGRVSFSAGSNEAYIRVDPTPDTEVEVGGETVRLTVNTLAGQNYTVGSPDFAEGVITDDDTSVAVQVLVRDAANAIGAGNSVTENGESELVFRFTRTGITTGSLVVNYTIGGVAINGVDYGSISGTATIPDGQASVDVIVDPTPDSDVEPNEDVIITVAANGALYTIATTPGSSASATGFITNDDTTYRIEFAGLAVRTGTGTPGDPFVYTPTTVEGNPPGETVARFRIIRDGANSSAGGTVTWATVPGSGTATAGPPNTACAPGQDYTSDGDVEVFTGAGATETITVDVRVCRDLVFELTETFDVALSNPTGGQLLSPATSLATAVIVDDDAAPFLQIDDVTVNENAGTATIRVRQVNQAGNPQTTGLNTSFSFSTGAAGDTATANVDYTSTSATGSIPAGSTETTVTVAILDDNLDEPNEFFTVTINSATNASLVTPAAGNADPVARVTITDNESATTFAVSDVRQIEGNPSVSDPQLASTSAFNFRITRTGDAQANEVVCYQTVDGDLENPGLNPNPATGGAPPPMGPNWTGSPDYNPITAGPTNCVTFTQGGPSVITVPVIVYGDPVFENDESFTFQLLTIGSTTTNGTAGGARFTDALGLGLIQNDDGVVAFEISGPTSVTEGNTDGATPTPGPQTTTLTYTITRPNSGVASSVRVNVVGAATGNTLTATLGTSCGALNSGVDVAKSAATNPTTLNFPASGTGSTSQTFTVTVCGDTADETDETFRVFLDQASNAIVGANGSVTTTILDDDATPVVSVSDVVVCEPNTGTAAAVFTITRTGLSFLTSTVRVNTVDGTAQDDVPATEDNDYVGIVNQLVTFGPGETTKTVTVTINGDLKFETDETFTLQVDPATSGSNAATNILVDPTFGADPIGGGIISNSASVCGGQEDPAPTFAVGPVTQVEGTTNPVTPAPFFFRVTRTGTTQLNSTFTFATTSGGNATVGTSCTSGVDYISTSQTVSFPADGFTLVTTGGAQFGGAQGPNFIDVPVQVCQDADFETNETFNVTLSGPVNSQISPTGTTAVGTITNDDGLSFMIRNPGPEGAEGNTGQTTNFNFTIDRIGGPGVGSTVCYQTIAGTATPGVDYTPYDGTTNCVTFSTTATSATVTVPVIGDNAPEADETFFLRLISATNGATFPTVGSDDRLATINNDDPGTPPSGKEGDIVDAAGTPAGDGVLLANDISVLRQFILGTATPTGTQFQRADINGTCGDGAINAADVTVARQWLLNSTPLPDACGPTVPAIVNPLDESNRPEAVGRIIRAVNTQGAALPNQTIVVQIQLDSQGDEASMSHTINWNPAAFNFVSAVAGTYPTGTVLNLNTTQTAQGRLGVLIDGTNPFATGTRQILTLTLTTTATATAGTYPVTFSSTPTPQSVSNPTGTLLQTTYEAGNIVLTTTAAGVRVSGRVTTAGGQGLRNATVVLTDSEGNRRVATTGSFGIYTFEDVEVGQSYVVGVQARRYRFTSRVVNVTDSLTDVNFVGQE